MNKVCMAIVAIVFMAMAQEQESELDSCSIELEVFSPIIDSLTLVESELFDQLKSQLVFQKDSAKVREYLYESEIVEYTDFLYINKRIGDKESFTDLVRNLYECKIQQMGVCWELFACPENKRNAFLEGRKLLSISKVLMLKSSY